MIVIIGGKTLKGNINVTVAPAARSDGEAEDRAAGDV